MYAVVDALGNPIKFIMSKGQRHDSKFLIRLLMELKMNNCNVLAEQAYNTDEILKYINTNNANAIIPPKSNRKIKRKFDKYIYKERYLVQCLFQKLSRLCISFNA